MSSRVPLPHRLKRTKGSRSKLLDTDSGNYTRDIVKDCQMGGMNRQTVEIKQGAIHLAFTRVTWIHSATPWQPGKDHVTTHNQKHNFGTCNMAAWWLCSSILKETLKSVACPESDTNPGISRREQRKSQSCHSRVPSKVAVKGIVRNEKSFRFRLRYLKLRALRMKRMHLSFSREHDETSLAAVTVEHSLLIQGITCRI